MLANRPRTSEYCRGTFWKRTSYSKPCLQTSRRKPKGWSFKHPQAYYGTSAPLMSGARSFVHRSCKCTLHCRLHLLFARCLINYAGDWCLGCSICNVPPLSLINSSVTRIPFLSGTYLQIFHFQLKYITWNAVQSLCSKSILVQFFNNHVILFSFLKLIQP